LTEASTPSRTDKHAIVFVPHSHPVNGHLAQRTLAHLRNRRYEFIALLRDWPIVNSMLGSGHANIVVMPSTVVTPNTERLCDDGDTVRLWPDTPPVAEEWTPDRDAPRRRAAGNGRFVSGRLPRERVRELLYGSGDVTAPVGLDPESIAAVRRIVRHMDQRPSL
jgi:hypothetical protein